MRPLIVAFKLRRLHQPPAGGGLRHHTLLPCGDQAGIRQMLVLDVLWVQRLLLAGWVQGRLVGLGVECM